MKLAASCLIASYINTWFFRIIMAIKKEEKKDILILGINGSPNKDGLCSRLLKKALKEVEKRGAKTKIFDLIDIEKEFYHSQYVKEAEDDFKELSGEILKADGFILATPVYWMNVSSLMKNFIEKLTIFELRDFQLEGKVAGFIATCEEDGAWKAILDMAGPLSHMGMIFPPYSMFFYNKRFSDKSDNEWMENDVELMGKNVVELCKVIKKTNPNWGYGE